MSKKNINTTSDDVRESISSIYAELLKARKLEKEAKEEKKRLKKKEKEEKEEQESKMTKKERREAEFNAWKDIIEGLTGDDLEYKKTKKKKKKYHKWIDDDNDQNVILTKKSKKQKKKNYNKEFEAELHMLKSLVADQNKFTLDLQKRFQNAAGPATKDASPLNKALVDLASNINTSRNNSLAMLKAIGDIKRTIADLYMKQKKLDGDSGGGFNNMDVGLMGSNIAASLFNNDQFSPGNYLSSNQSNIANTNPSSGQNNISYNTVLNQAVNDSENQLGNMDIESFDPNSWEGPLLGSNNSTYYENIPHSIVVEWHKNDNKARFKAVHDDTGEELVGCPVPTIDPSKLSFNEKDLLVKGQFDETYKLEIL